MDGSSQPATQTGARKWVWRSTPDSVKSGTVSLVALVEILFATALFGLLALNTSSPWTSLIGFMAAPILLLRSEQSIQAGLRLFSTVESPAFYENRLVRTIATCSIAIALAAMLYIAAKDTAKTVTLFATIMTVSIVPTIYIESGMNKIKHRIATIYVTFLMAAAVFGNEIARTLSITCLALLPVQILFLSRKMLPPHIDKNKLRAHPYSLAGIIGVILEATIIRAACGLMYAPSGWRHFGNNYRTSLFVLDIVHMPEILPGVSCLEPELGLETLIRHRHQGAWNQIGAIVLATLVVTIN